MVAVLAVLRRRRHQDLVPSQAEAGGSRGAAVQRAVHEKRTVQQKVLPRRLQVGGVERVRPVLGVVRRRRTGEKEGGCRGGGLRREVRGESGGDAAVQLQLLPEGLQDWGVAELGWVNTCVINNFINIQQYLKLFCLKILNLLEFWLKIFKVLS